MSERAGQRVAAFALAGVFFFSSVALTGFVIWQIRKDSQTAAPQTDSAAAAAAAKQAQQNTPQEGKLKGTKLADFTALTTPVSALQKIDITEGSGNPVPDGTSVNFVTAAGLSLSGGLASGGQISVQSEVRRGTTLTFTLPLAKGVVASPASLHTYGL